MPSTIATAGWWLFATLLAALAMVAIPSRALAAFGDRPLHRGSRGHDVRVLQSWLTRVRVHTRVDGVYGRRTARNVRRFERSNHRKVDGRVSRADAATLRALVEGEAPRTATSTPAATVTPDGRTAAAPPGAPVQAQAAIAAANQLTSKPYKWGGGHGHWVDDG